MAQGAAARGSAAVAAEVVFVLWRATVEKERDRTVQLRADRLLWTYRVCLAWGRDRAGQGRAFTGGSVAKNQGSQDTSPGSQGLTIW